MKSREPREVATVRVTKPGHFKIRKLRGRCEEEEKETARINSWFPGGRCSGNRRFTIAVFRSCIVWWQDAGHISRSEEPYKNLAHSHRQRRVPLALQPHRDSADSVFAYRHHSSIRGQPHRLHSQQRPARGRAEHLLLDTQHVYDYFGVSQERRCGSAFSRRRQFEVVY